jgi:hypothetical protein
LERWTTNSVLGLLCIRTDPYLGFVLAQPAVSGIQSQKVIANAKHFVNNNQETNRNTVLEIVDERTRFEMYYPPFEGVSNFSHSPFFSFFVWPDPGNNTPRKPPRPPATALTNGSDDLALILLRAVGERGVRERHVLVQQGPARPAGLVGVELRKSDDAR